MEHDFSSINTELLDFCRIVNFLALENNLLSQEKENLEQELVEAQKRNLLFEEQFKLWKQRQFGKKTEANLLQLSLFDGLEVIEEKANPPKIQTITYNRSYSTGRKIDTSKLARERRVHDLNPEEKVCKCCGKDLEKIGEDISKQLEYIPATVKVIEHVCPKYTCRSCETVSMAHKPEAPIAKCLAAASLITEVIISKYDHHLPLYRQAKIFLQNGVNIPANTLGNWIMQAGTLLMPLQEALWKQLNKTNILQTDETPVTLLSTKKQGYMWAYHSLAKQNRFIMFEYNNSRGGEVVNNRLSDYKGYFQNVASLLYSLIQTCKLNDINPRAYLNYVLNQVHKLRRYQIDPAELLPQFIDKKLLA